MTQYYIGTKQIQAQPMEQDGRDGYRVIYPDGYESWSPKDVFEKAYLPMGEDNDGSKITLEMVEAFIAKTETVKMGDKTTVVQATLRNGFIITESSSCVDPMNYSEDVGHHICIQRIHGKIWELLGFLLQSARNGVV